MPKFRVITEWSGYSRGNASYIIEADSKEEAEKKYFLGDEEYREVVRDDTEDEVESIEEIKDEA